MSSFHCYFQKSFVVSAYMFLNLAMSIMDVIHLICLYIWHPRQLYWQCRPKLCILIVLGQVHKGRPTWRPDVAVEGNLSMLKLLQISETNQFTWKKKFEVGCCDSCFSSEVGCHPCSLNKPVGALDCNGFFSLWDRVLWWWVWVSGLMCDNFAD